MNDELEQFVIDLEIACDHAEIDPPRSSVVIPFAAVSASTFLNAEMQIDGVRLSIAPTVRRLDPSPRRTTRILGVNRFASLSSLRYEGRVIRRTQIRNTTQVGTTRIIRKARAAPIFKHELFSDRHRVSFRFAKRLFPNTAVSRAAPS